MKLWRHPMKFAPIIAVTSLFVIALSIGAIFSTAYEVTVLRQRLDYLTERVAQDLEKIREDTRSLNDLANKWRR